VFIVIILEKSVCEYQCFRYVSDARLCGKTWKEVGPEADACGVSPSAITAPDFLVRSLSLHCQVNLCKGAGNLQSIIPHIRSFLCNIVKF
jgi:hypothetical protein